MTQRLVQPEPNAAFETDDPNAFPYAGARTGTDSRPDVASPAICPACGARTLSVQGLSDCPDCEWTSQ